MQGNRIVKKLLRFPGKVIAVALRTRFDGRRSQATMSRRSEWERMANGRSSGSKVSCENCFFHQNMLCAVTRTDSACATFRPNRPEGLRPPSQMRFTFRQERRMQVAWAFPSAQEQVALHA
jgi:hypothetical protein